MMETIQGNPDAFVPASHKNWAYQDFMAELGGFISIRIKPTQQHGTSRIAMFAGQCGSDVAGQVISFPTCLGEIAQLAIDGCGTVLSLASRMGRHAYVDVMVKEEGFTGGKGGFMYTGRISAAHAAHAISYDYDSTIPSHSITATGADSSITCILLVARGTIIGSFHMQPSCLDLAVPPSMFTTRDLALLLGIAYSIWRLIPWT